MTKTINTLLMIALVLGFCIGVWGDEHADHSKPPGTYFFLGLGCWIAAILWGRFGERRT